MITKDFTLPTEEELNVEELKLSTPALFAGSFQLGKFCETPSKEFMLCKREEKDPRKCLNEGKLLTQCGLDFFRLVKENCKSEFDQYAHCIDKSSIDFSKAPCRNTQSVYDQCMLEKLGMWKVSNTYFLRAKVHDSERPRNPGYISPEFPDAAKEIEIPKELPPANHGSRFFFYP